MTIIINLVILLIAVALFAVATFIFSGKKENILLRKIEARKTKRDQKKDKLKKWKNMLGDEDNHVLEEDDLKVLKKEIKELRSLIAAKTKEIASNKELKNDEVIKNLEANLLEKENQFNKHNKIFKAKWISSLDIEEALTEIEKLENQISSLHRTCLLWVVWIVPTGVATVIMSFVAMYFLEKINATENNYELISSIVFWGSFFIIQIWALYKGYTEVPEKHEYVIVFFGKYFSTWEPGLHFLFPFWMKIDSKVYMGDQSILLNFTKAEKDIMSAKMDFIDASAEVVATIFFRVFSSKRAVFQPGDLKGFVSEKMESGIRAYYGKMTLDQAIIGRADVDLRQIVIQDATEAGLFKSWGIRITSIAITDIQLPKEVDEIRQKKLTAEKEREVAEITLKTEGINANIAEVQGSAEGRRLVKLAELLKLPLEQMVEYDKFIRHQEALGKAGVLIANSGKNNDAASVGAIASTVATVATQKPTTTP